MRTWGTETLVGDAAGSDAHFAQLQARHPPVERAYRPSGKVPFTGALALLIGGAVSSVAGALTGVLVGGISLGLFALMGFLIAVIAFCGFVACITLFWGLGIAVIGGGLTFGGLGWVAGALTAWFGKLGKNRNVTAAIAVSFVATFFAWCALASLPPIVAMLVPPSDDDFSLGGLVHLFGDYGWFHVVVLVVGLLFALVMAFVGAEDTVRQQRFCEPCDLYMTDKRLPAASLVVAEQVMRSATSRDVVPIVDLLSGDTGSDLEPSLHVCPKCGSGYLDGRLWARTKWLDSKGDKTAERDWLVLSVALGPSAALPLTRLPDRQD